MRIRETIETLEEAKQILYSIKQFYNSLDVLDQDLESMDIELQFYSINKFLFDSEAIPISMSSLAKHDSTIIIYWEFIENQDKDFYTLLKELKEIG